MRELREQLREQLREELRRAGSVLVCFSGGVDSSYLLAEAVATLGRTNAVAFTAVSPSLDPDEARAAAALASALGAEHLAIETAELDDARYRKNDVDRCYHCKREVYGVAIQVARTRGLCRVIDGLHRGDRGDHRPGRAAAEELGVESPLDAIGFDKDAIREAARALGLPVWDKPALACLASRFPYGTEVTRERLQKVGTAERAIRALGFEVVRVRFHEELARVELGVDELAAADDRQLSAVIFAANGAGFSRAEIDPRGYRRGSMNERRRLPIV